MDQQYNTLPAVQCISVRQRPVKLFCFLNALMQGTLCSCFREIQVEYMRELLALAKAWKGTSALYRTEIKDRINAK